MKPKRHREEYLRPSREHRPRWIGTWRTPELTGKRLRKTHRVILGYVDELSEAQAKKAFRLAIQHNDEERGAHLNLKNLPSRRIVALPVQSHRANGLKPGQVGAIAELAVSAAMLAKGLEVYRAVNPHAPFDLVYVDGGRLVRVEVKCAVVTTSGRIRCPTLHRQAGAFDILAVLMPDGSVRFKPLSEITTPEYPFDDAKELKNSFHLTSIAGEPK